MLPKFPFFNSQELNLDWILEKLSAMYGVFVPYVKLAAISEDTDAALISAFNSNVDMMPLGFSVLHFGVPNEDELQVFAICYRTDTESGTANIYTTGTDITLSVLDMVDGIWVAGTAPEYGTTVVANPVLAGTEANLTGLQVGDTKYKVPEGGGGATVIHLDFGLNTADMKAGELYQAFSSGPVIVQGIYENELVMITTLVSADVDSGYSFTLGYKQLDDNMRLVASTADDYPTVYTGGGGGGGGGGIV